MDRNPYIPLAKVRHCVALRKESVDRNLAPGTAASAAGRSLSARRAWIEMLKGYPLNSPARVALRKESVDRNVNAFVTVQHQLDGVALRKESVDRNKKGQAK